MRVTVRQRQGSGMLFVLAAASLWGLWVVWVRGAASGPATSVIAQAVGAVVLLPWAARAWAARQRRGVRVSRRQLAWLVALGACNAANVWLYFRALDDQAVAPAVLAHYLCPVLVALAAPRLLGEPRSPRTPLGLGLALGGTACVLLGGGDFARSGAAWHAFALGAGSAVFYAGATLIAKRVGSGFGDSELYAWPSLVAAALAFLVTPIPALGVAWIRPAVGGVVSAALAGVLYYAGMRRLPAERVGILATWEVVAAVVVGMVGYGEHVGLAAVIGGAAILAGGLVVMDPRASPSV
jgi:drug/metabolite transporter (DMT)-like permease